MTDVEQPQLYLVTPASFDLTGFPDLLGRILDTVPVACLRLEMASQDEDDILRAAEILRNSAHARDVAIVIADHVLLADR
ncbi:MAG: thiamine phosphate synthase, partial [Arenibacterium sp.]